MSNEAKSDVTSSEQAWAKFWGGSHSIYVNARHVEVHYARLAHDLKTLIERRNRPLVLDWGCGDALSATAIVGACGELWLYDAVGPVRQRIAHRFASTPSIRVLDDAEWQSLAPASLDMITVVSVAQYLGREELERLLDRFRHVVRPDGEIIFADIIPPHVSMIADIASLLGTGWRHGFFLAACIGLARTFFSEYRRIRATAGFSCYEEADFRALCTRHGFAVERLPHNIGFNQQRMTFRLRPST